MTLVGVAVAALVAVAVVFHSVGTEGTATAEPAKPAPSSQVSVPVKVTTTVKPPAPTTTALPADVRLATAVYDLKTDAFVNRSEVDTPFAAESLTKLLIAMDLGMAGKLTGDTLPKVQAMLATSDDQTANQLWTSDGSTQIVSRSVRSMGLKATTPPRDPGRWGDMTTTAADVVRIYQFLMTRMPAGPRDIVLRDLTALPRAADGTDQDFGITAAVPAGQWWVKQAWACCRPAWDVHTTGLVGPGQRYIVVAMSQQPVAGGFGGAAKVMTEVARRLVAGLAS
ncbi:beta-lactamase class A [Kutzneria buriramensis]|uniref:Beta-lactamase class A n=1 Tax=Kutzneria buriramensis TaxID=1045776 RepID=A0A3E0GUM8_9PSEU|nr:beta-lactamase class A [Kutzneria buriramensis]